jgi:hypothetical protein
LADIAEKNVSEPDRTVSPLLEPLTALIRLLAHFNNQGVIIGGIAASLLGKPRLTADLDAVFLLPIRDLPKLVEVAELHEIQPRIANVIDFARKNRIVLLRHGPSGTNIDISLGVLPFEEQLVERSITREVAGLAIPLPTPEDLIILKAVAHRPKDLFDIQEIIKSNPDLDRKHIENWLMRFAEALELPEIWDDTARLL